MYPASSSFQAGDDDLRARHGAHARCGYAGIVRRRPQTRRPALCVHLRNARWCIDLSLPTMRMTACRYKYQLSLQKGTIYAHCSPDSHMSRWDTFLRERSLGDSYSAKTPSTIIHRRAFRRGVALPKGCMCGGRPTSIKQRKDAYLGHIHRYGLDAVS